MSSKQQIISSKKVPILSRLRELFDYMDLLWMLSYRDFRVKYAQSILGALWAIINPMLTALILSFIFGIVLKVETPNNMPHILFTMAGMMGWTFFSSLLSDAGGALIGAQSMIKKIYFPRLIIPFSKLLTAMIDFFIVFLVFSILVLYYGYSPSVTILYFPLFMLLLVFLGLGLGLWVSALTIRFRDIQHVIPLLLRIGMYAVPIAYPVSNIPQQYEFWYFLNPMAGIIEGMRWSLLGVGENPPFMAMTIIIVFIVFISGLLYFSKIERTIADLI